MHEGADGPCRAVRLSTSCYSTTTLPTWLHETDGCDFHIGMCSMHIVASNIGVVAVYLSSVLRGPEGLPALRCAAAATARHRIHRTAQRAPRADRSQRDESAALVHSEDGRAESVVGAEGSQRQWRQVGSRTEC